MKKEIALILLSAALGASAEFGVGTGGTFNYKADFRSEEEPQGLGSTPYQVGSRTYDDGSVYEDDIPSYPAQTRYYSYDQTAGASVVNNPAGGGSLTLHSSQSILDAQQFSGQQTEGQPALEIYWQGDITDNERFNMGLRAALHWQRIDLETAASGGSTVQTVNHTYTYDSGALLTDSYDGTLMPAPGYPALNDTPSETISYTDGSTIAYTRELDADLFGLDLGPTLSVDLTEKLRLSASLGGTVAWIDSEFSYFDDSFSQGRTTNNDWLFGAYASADLSVLIGEHWGLFGGAAYTRLENFKQQTHGRSAELQFNDSYTVRTGIFFR